jgi:hypothetical protein
MRKNGMQSIEQREAHWQKGTDLTEQQLEALGILQEECAEVIQEASKIRRSGPNFCRKGSDIPNLIHFQNEVMDMRIMIHICQLLGVYEEPDAERVSDYMDYKIDRLRKWSKLGSVLDEL